MTKTATMALAVAWATLSVFGYDWPDSGSVTLTTADCDEAGEVVVTDADYAKANGLSGISVGAGVKLVFSTTAAPTVALSGTGGTFVKRGDAEWTLMVAQPSFNGDWVLEGGVTIVDVNATCSFGAESAKYALYVRSGASFTVTAAALEKWRLYNRKLHLSGTGYQNKGAYYSLGNTSSTYAWRDFVLDDDTTVRLDNGYVFVSGTTYEFNGHTLTVLGSKHFYWMSGSPQNGRIVVGDGTDKPILCERGTFVTTDTEFETVLNPGSTLTLYNEPAAYCGKLTVNGAVKLLHTHQNKDDICTEVDSTVCLAGPVNLARTDSMLTCSFSDQPEKVCNPYLMKISGYVYGPGGITVSASGSCEKSIVLSCPTNAFTGPVKVTAGSLRVLDHGAVPDFAKVSVADGAALVAVLPAEGDGWTEDDLGDLNESVLRGHGRLRGGPLGAVRIRRARLRGGGSRGRVRAGRACDAAHRRVARRDRNRSDGKLHEGVPARRLGREHGRRGGRGAAALVGSGRKRHPLVYGHARRHERRYADARLSLLRRYAGRCAGSGLQKHVGDDGGPAADL